MPMHQPTPRETIDRLGLAVVREDGQEEREGVRVEYHLMMSMAVRRRCDRDGVREGVWLGP